MSKGPLLPTNVPTFKHESARNASGVPTGKLLVGLLMITSVNIFVYTKPQISSYYISSIHHKVASWTSLPSILDNVLVHLSVSTSGHPVAAGSADTLVQYTWIPSGRTEPLASEPGIDLPDTFDSTTYLTHEIDFMTGEPGLDISISDEDDKDSGVVFETAIAANSEEEPAPLDWLSIAHALNVDLTDKKDIPPPIDWSQVAKELDEYSPAEGGSMAVTGETLSSRTVQRIEWELSQDKKDE